MMNEADVLDPEFNSKNWNLEQGITSVRKTSVRNRKIVFSISATRWHQEFIFLASPS